MAKKIDRIDGQLDLFCIDWSAALEPVTVPTAAPVERPTAGRAEGESASGEAASLARNPRLPQAVARGDKKAARYALSIAAEHAGGAFAVYGTRTIEAADPATWAPDWPALRALFPSLADAQPGEALRMFLHEIDADGRPVGLPVRRMMATMDDAGRD